MGKEYVVEQAVCLCKFGVAPGILKVTDNMDISMNGKLVATNNTLGNVFMPPAFGMCRINPLFPKPCTPLIIKWTNYYEGVSINTKSYPLTELSQGTCSLGCPNCISIQKTGQIPIPGIIQVRKAAFEHQNEINPLGRLETLNEDFK